MGLESFNNTPPQEQIPKQSVSGTEIPDHLFSKNPYEVLGVSRTASTEEIEEARKNLQRKFHPDVNQNPKAKEVAQNINNAFDILSGRDKHAVLGGSSASKINSQARQGYRPENKPQSDYVNDTLNNIWKENEARFKHWQEEQNARFNSHEKKGQSNGTDFEQKRTGTNPKTSNINSNESNEVVTVAAKIEMGVFVPGNYFTEIMEYGRVRNVRVDFRIEKETPFSKIYKVEFKGKLKDIETVANYIKNRPRVTF